MGKKNVYKGHYSVVHLKKIYKYASFLVVVVVVVIKKITIKIKNKLKSISA